jgi:TetR/AcrR family tetracycline transcriptional repressor
VEAAELSDGPKGSSEAERIAARYGGFSAVPAGAATIMATYVSTEQYMWGLHRGLDGIAGG